MKYRLRRSAHVLTGALLASTALISPANAQSAPNAPERFQTLDGNGVDLVTGTYAAPFTEGKIGSGEGAVSIVENSAGPDQWSGVVYETTLNGVVTMVVQLGAIADTFTQSGTTWVPTKANGTALTTTGNPGEWRYTGRDGTAILFESVINANQVAGPSCTSVNADAGSCAIPMSITRPDGMVFHLNWDFDNTCNPAGVLPCQNATANFRFKGVTTSAGYGFSRTYVTDNPGTGSAPVSDWYARTGATFSDGTTVTYGTPSSGVRTVTDTLGRVWTFTTAADGSTHIQRPGSAADNIIVGTNTTNGTVTFVTKDGVTTNYSRTVDGTGTTATIVATDPLGHTRTIVADLTLGRVTSITDENGHTTSYAYDSNARLTKVTQPEGNFSQFTYDPRGNVTLATLVAKAGSGLPNIVTSASFDPTCSNPVTCNKPNGTTDAKGNVTSYTYDPTHGGPLTVTRPAPTSGAVQPQMRLSYTQVTSAQGELVYRMTAASQCQTTASCTGTADETKVTSTYNAQLLPTTMTHADGTGALSATTTATYDARGNPNTVDGPLAGTADTIKYRYDAADQLIGETSPDPDGTGAMIPRAVRLTHRPDGQISKEELGTVTDQTDAAWTAFAPNQTVDVTFDANSRPVQRKLSSGSTAYTLTQVSYDSLGRIDCTATRMNPAVYGNLPAACTLSTAGSFGPDRIRQNKYDAAGHVTQRLAGVGTNVATTQRTMTYTNNGRLATLADGNASTTTYAYDGFDRLSQTTYPVPQAGGTAPTELFAYDANSNLSSHTLRDGTVITFARDNLNRVTLKTLPGTEPSVSYAYDNLGRLTSANQTGNNVSFTYDALSRKLSETGPQGTATSTFDLAGRRTSLAYPAAAGATNLTIAYNYLTTGEVSSIMDGATSLATYTYDNLGKRAGVTLGNGVVQSYTRDPISRLTTLTDNLAGATNDLTIGGSTSPITYNPAGQITSVMRSNDTYAWNGAVPVTRSYVKNLLNQYLSTSSGGTTTATFTNDTKGNLTSDSTNSFCYSSENLLNSKGGTCGAPTVAVSYDPGKRLYQVAGSTTTRFAYSGRKMLADYDGSNALQHRYVFGPGVDEPIVEYSSTGVRTWLLADERGSIIARTSSSGALVTANSYDEYGIPSSNNIGLFQYTGQAWISQLGMNYYKTRIYSPTMGRFMQTDRIGIADNANLYAYVHNDPVNSKDSAGTCAEGCVIGIGIGIGVGVEMLKQFDRTGSIDLSPTGLEEDAVGGLAGGAAAAGAIVFGSDTVGLAIYYGVVGADAAGADDLLNGTTGPQLYNDMLFGAATGELLGFGGLGLDALLDTSSYSTAFIADNGDFVIDAGGDFYTVAAQDTAVANAFFSGLLFGVVDSITVSAYDEFGNPVNLVVPYADDSMSDSFSNDPLGLGFDDPLGGTSTGDPSNDPNDPLGLDPGSDSENGIGGGSGN